MSGEVIKVRPHFSFYNNVRVRYAYGGNSFTFSIELISHFLCVSVSRT